MKIFILKPSSLGDVIQALPVLRLLRLRFPHSEIFWWIDAALAPLLTEDPDLNGLILFDRRRWAAPRHWAEVYASVQSIRAHRFDWVIDLQSLLRSGAVAWLANATLTVGLDDSREGARGFYDLIVPRPSYHTHAVDWYLATLPPLGVPVHRSFTWLPPQPKAAEQIKSASLPLGARWIALQPGARWENKRWPLAHFAETIRHLGRLSDDLHFVILGGESDRAAGRTLAEALPGRCLDVAGRTSLPQMIEWLRVCELMITNDTGPMHAAAALGKPVVALFGPTEPRRTGPYGQVEGVLRHALPCAPCMKDTCRWPQPMECLQALAPGLVVERVRTLLQLMTPSDAPSGRASPTART